MTEQNDEILKVLKSIKDWLIAIWVAILVLIWATGM